ncbi:hypothetical protein M0804_000216 [Polistes exclamans]|nr:hypothetical protein M0804_000216 [Polistes exclamans]
MHEKPMEGGWDRLTNRRTILVDLGLKARPSTPTTQLLGFSRVYLVAKAPRAPAGLVTLESSCVYDGLRGIPIQRSRDIRKQYPACTGDGVDDDDDDDGSSGSDQRI